MLGLLNAFIEQVGQVGVKGLAEVVHPAAGKAVDFFGGVWKRWQLQRQREQQRAEIEAMARMTAAQVADEIREQLQQTLPESPALRSEIEIYLSMAPAALRASLKRAEDPTGRSVPGNFQLRGGSDLVELFPAHVPQLRPGDTLPGIDCWVLMELIGAGGFGEVWLVRSEVDDTLNAVKFCTNPDGVLQLIEHELRQILRLRRDNSHPGIVPLIMYSFTVSKPWLMYEYAGGGTLTDSLLQWQNLPKPERFKESLAALMQITEAVSHLHKLNPPLVHRDLKPANVLRCHKTGRFRITDLGLGGSAAEYELSRESRGGVSLVGRLPTLLSGSHTPLYASPEQRKGEFPDPRDDVHALGVVGYQLFTGWVDVGPRVELTEDLHEAGVPDPLIDIIRRCVSARAEKRFANATEIAAAIRATGLVPQPVSPTVEVPPEKPVQSQPGRLIASMPSSKHTEPTVDLRIRGKWWWRPLGHSKTPWKSERETPATLLLEPEREYRLEVASSIKTPDLLHLSVLASAASLVRLDLSNCTGIAAEGFAHLQPLQHLQHLNCYGCNELNDTALAAIARLRNLARLDLTRCKRITDSGLSAMFQLQNLEQLDLSGCEWVTDDGLVSLSKLPQLRHLGLRNTRTTDEGVARLQRTIPLLTVDR